jgi:anti-sigma factor RsiW
MKDADRHLMLHALLDGELDPASAIEMEDALAQDPALRANYERLRALRSAIRAHAPREAAPDSLRARMAALAANDAPRATLAVPAPPATRAPGRFAERPSWRAFASAMAATIVVTAGLQHALLVANAPNETLLALTAGHMRGQISGQPFDVASSDRHTVKPWLAAKLPVATSVVDLAAEGFPLAGGRIDIIDGAPAPTLVYKRREHIISLTQLPARGRNWPKTPERLAQDGFPLFVWSDGDRAFAVVSDLAPNELEAFVALYRRESARENGRG